MRLSHADYRPGKRPRHVPSGAPRRKIPLIRIALLLALAAFVYVRFEHFWPRVMGAVNPTALWHKAFGSPRHDAEIPVLAWAKDSSLATLECPAGLTAACCQALVPGGPGLCGEASALLAKARWKRALDGATVRALRLEARSVVSDLGDWDLELAAARGRDAAGTFYFRRGAGGKTFCDRERGCLGEVAPRPPLAQGVLLSSFETGAGVWKGPSPQVRAALPGRILNVDSTREGVRVRVYHGREAYVDYGPLRAANGVQAGARVRPGSLLGLAPGRGGEYALAVRVRQGGQNLDPAAFWRTGARDPGTEELSADLFSARLP